MTTNFSIEKLPILTAGGGTEINLCIHHYHAAATGKKVYIQAGLHGGETAQWSLKLLHDFLLNNLQSGEVCIIPYANPLGWLQRTYYATAGKFSAIDGRDINRLFPGKADGEMQERICAALMSQAQGCDLVIDLHTSKMSNPFAIYTKPEYEKYIRLCGFTYNQYSDDASIPSLHGTFNAALDRAGIDNLTIECGGHDEYDESKTTAVFAALKSLLSALKMLQPTETSAENIYTFEKRLKVFAPMAGLLKLNKKPGDKVSAGEQIGEILCAQNLAETQVVKTPINGILHTIIPSHICWEGDIVCEVIPEDNLNQL